MFLPTLAWAWDGQLYRYDLELKGVVSKPRDYDRYTKIVVDFLKANQLQTDCIDVKREYLTKSPTVRILLRSPIDPARAQDLGTRLCTGVVGRCELEGRVTVTAASELRFAYTLKTNPLQPPPKVRPKRFANVADHQLFPVFSTSCESGNTDDSYFMTLRSNESRDLVKRSGIDIQKVHVLVLAAKDGGTWWGFGGPDLYWNDRPLTKHNQELAPKEILEELP